MTPTDPAMRADAHTYAAEVRRHLDDLAPDELEELTGGLEADLLERAAESSTPLADRLGDPATYAAELRGAAGIAPRRRGSRLVTRLGSRARTPAAVRTAWSSAGDALRAQPWWPQISDFAVSIRPVWWVLRAWVAFALVANFLGARPVDLLPDSAAGWGVFIAFVVISVQLGRESGAHLPWLRWAVIGGNVVALALLPGVVNQLSQVRWDYENATASFVPEGLYFDGEPVTNLFPYDSDGVPLRGVQLFDAEGRPVAVTERGDWTGRRPQAFVPYTDPSGRRLWNAYPLYSALFDRSGERWRADTVRAAAPPFLIAPAVLPPETASGQTPSPSPTSVPTPTGTPTPTEGPENPTPAGPSATPAAGTPTPG